ncbi:MAG: hypothetical protein DCC71_17600 [Proteobacteria bacterium]|nr:MAG: hypothetical protein DCC71_17600 [Pseudomonadota bacterium]
MRPSAPIPTATDPLPDFAHPDFRRDPYPTYRAMRERTPVLRGERGAFRFSILTRHADVVAVLRDPRMSVDRPFQPRPPGDGDAVDPATLHPLARALRALSRIMLFRDPPDHTRLRGLVNKAFTPRMVESLRPRVAARVDELLAARLAAGELDVVRDLAEPLPILVIAELLGLPLSDCADLKRWSDPLAAMLDGSIAMQHLAPAVQAAGEVIEYLRGHLEAKRRDPQATSRVPLEDVELCGARFEKGREVGLLIGAANRDPDVFAEPDRFDLGRRDNRHVSFGFGIHFCLGAGLARLEGQLAIGSLVARAPRLRLAVADGDLAWRPGWLLRGLTALPVAV